MEDDQFDDDFKVSSSDDDNDFKVSSSSEDDYDCGAEEAFIQQQRELERQRGPRRDVQREFIEAYEHNEPAEEEEEEVSRKRTRETEEDDEEEGLTDEEEANKRQRLMLASSSSSSSLTTKSSLINAKKLLDLVNSKCEEHISKNITTHTCFRWMNQKELIRQGKQMPRYIVVDGKNSSVINFEQIIHDVSFAGTPVYPVFGIYQFPVFSNQLSPSAVNFGDGSLDVSGMNTFITLSFLCQVISDTRIGECRQSPDGELGACTLVSSHTCNVAGIEIPKISVFVELLTHETFDVENLLSNEITTDIISKLFHSDNEAGFRFTFLIHDPQISLNSAIRSKVAENAKISGLGREFVELPIDGPHATELMMQFFAGKKDPVEAYQKHASTANSKGIRQNAMRQKLREEKSKEEAKSVKDYKRFVVNMYNFHCVTRDQAGIDHISTADDAYVHLLDGNFANQVVLDVCDADRIFGLSNLFVEEQMEEHGVNPIQRDIKNYVFEIDTNVGKALEFCFPMNGITCFKTTAERASMDNLEKMRFPWRISFIELVIDSVNDVHTERRKTIYAEDDKSLFEQMPSTHQRYLRCLSNAHAQKVFEECGVNNNIIHVPENVTENTYRHTVNPSFMPTTEKIEANATDEFKIYNACEIEERKFIEYLKKASPFWGSLDRDSQDLVVKNFRENGMNSLNAVLSNLLPNNTHIMNTTAQKLRSLEQTGQTAVVEVKTYFPNIGIDGSRIVYDESIFCEIIGITNNTLPLIRVRNDMMSSSRSGPVDRVMGHSSDQPNYVLAGSFCTSKTISILKMEEFTLMPGTIQSIISQSSQAGTGLGVGGDGGVFVDECEKNINDPGFDDEARKQQNKFKVKFTGNYEESRLVLHLKKDGPGEKSQSIYESRKTALIKKTEKNVWVGAMNDFRPSKEGSVLSRIQPIFFPRMSSAGSEQERKLISMMLHIDSGTLKGALNKQQADATRLYVIQHALCTAANKGMSFGALPFVDTRILTFHLRAVLDELLMCMPSVTDELRIATTHISASARTDAVRHAVNCVFSEPTISPLVTINEDGEFVTEPFRICQLSLLKYFLCLTENLSIYLISQYICEQIIRKEYHDVALLFANRLCGYFTQEQLDKNPELIFGFKPSLWCETKGDIKIPNPNYLMMKIADEKELVTLIATHLGHERSIAQHFINKLKTITIRTIVNTTDHVNGISTVITKQIKVINVFEIITTEIDGDVTMYGRISIAYLNKFSREKVIQMIMNKMCYNGIRERDVALGVYDDRYPNSRIVRTHRVKPGTHSLNVRNIADENNSYNGIRDDNDHVTHEKRDAIGDLSDDLSYGEIVFDKMNLEQHIFTDYFHNAARIHDEDVIKAHFPENLNRQMENVHRIYPHKFKMCKKYPDDVLSERTEAHHSKMNDIHLMKNVPFFSETSADILINQAERFKAHQAASSSSSSSMVQTSAPEGNFRRGAVQVSI